MGGVTYEILSNQGLLPPTYEVSPIRLNYLPKNPASATKIENGFPRRPPAHDRLYLLDIVHITGFIA